MTGAVGMGLGVHAKVGPTPDGRIKPELVAPGDNITSAASDGVDSSRQCTTDVQSGTSMAAPLVAAGAALVRQYFMQGVWHRRLPFTCRSFLTLPQLLALPHLGLAEQQNFAWHSLEH